MVASESRWFIQIIKLFHLVASRKFIKFCVVGFIGAILQYTFYHFFLLVLPQTNPCERVSFFIAIAIVALCNFIGNALWTFRVKK
jgi:putative flippase GtrA